MDIHVNDLVFEEGYKNVLLKNVSFRDIDQEFIFVKTEKSFDTDVVNILYYCFVKPYQGQVFRRIGETDERNNKIYVDEDLTDIEDLSYSDIEDATISKIIENGDLISNQLIVNIPFDFYDGNDELKELLETRKLKWLDEKRLKGNPDFLQIEWQGQICKYRIISCQDEAVVAETADGKIVLIDRDWNIYNAP